MVKTRFAPSPTGSLHIGGVRTILFNWLYAKHNNGKFVLRIEDTDIERSKEEHTQEILNTIKWLGLSWDDELIYQRKNIVRHVKVAHQLLQEGKAYKCYCTAQELQEERETAARERRTPKYSRKCRNLMQQLDKPFTVRLKTETTGRTEFEDLIQGVCGVENEYMDDMILLRSDNTPTYMLAVVVDDHDMEISHVIRGSEHLNNAYRQMQIYKACNWKAPEFGHVSLIHGEDGAKLSKRHGAASLDYYKDEGFFKEAILNYLLRLGWSYGDDEIISMQEAVKLFDIRNVHSSAARFSLDKLLSVNAIYLRNKENAVLLNELQEFVGKEKYDAIGWERIKEGMDELKIRTRTLKELAHMSQIYGYENYFGKIEYNEIIELIAKEALCNSWKEDSQAWLRELLEKNGKALKEVAPALRFALTKEKVAPSVFELMRVLGPKIFATRLNNANKNS